MKKYIFLFYFLLQSVFSFCQDTTFHKEEKKFLLEISGSGYYKFIFDNQYIKPTAYNYGDDFSKHQYERFNKFPTFGFSAGLLFTHRFGKQCGITTGLMYFLRRDVFENNEDTVIKYGNGSSMRDIHNVLKYDYSFNNIELPLMFQFSAMKFNFHTGFYFALISYKKAEYTYVVNQYSNTPQWITSEKTITGWEMPFKLFPTIQISYEVEIKKIKFSPFLAFYYAVKNQNDIYTQLGINFPIIKNNKSKK